MACRHDTLHQKCPDMIYKRCALNTTYYCIFIMESDRQLSLYNHPSMYKTYKGQEMIRIAVI